MSRRLSLLIVCVLAVAGGVAFLRARTPPPAPPAGMVRQDEVRLSSEIAGRLDAMLVAPGQHVEAGAPIAQLQTPELAAALDEAEAAANAARAERDRVLSGVRPEQVAIAEEALSAAEAQLTLAGEVYRRISGLSADNVASRAQLDESRAALDKAAATKALRQAELRSARAGATAEERALAEAQVALAEARVAELAARVEKARITAPVAGTVGVTVAEVGEVLVPGKPVATLVPDRSDWLGFTLREDRLAGLAIGSKVAVRDAAGTAFAARVSELRPLGEFATWRAARAVGDHDLTSFRLRLEPVAGGEALEPGQTVWLQGQQ